MIVLALIIYTLVAFFFGVAFRDEVMRGLPEEKRDEKFDDLVIVSAFVGLFWPLVLAIFLAAFVGSLVSKICGHGIDRD